jgi:hypothetical protein
MLECFFDDSGSHQPSRVMVWGGLIGESWQWEQLRSSWSKRLADPLPGKPPLKKFSLSRCAAAEATSEFAFYKPAERDALRYEFRQLIVDSGLYAVSCSVSVPDWDELVQGAARAFFGTASEVAMGGCIRVALEYAETWSHQEVRLTFDEGQATEGLRGQVARVKSSYLGTPNLVDIDFQPVISTLELQAADTIATETYWNAGDWLKDGSTEFRPHFASLLRSISANGYILDRDEIQSNLRRFEAGMAETN